MGIRQFYARPEPLLNTQKRYKIIGINQYSEEVDLGGLFFGAGRWCAWGMDVRSTSYLDRGMADAHLVDPENLEEALKQWKALFFHMIHVVRTRP